MDFGVFIHRPNSIDDDSPAERDQFPRQYLGRVQACLGDWILSYEPRKLRGTLRKPLDRSDVEFRVIDDDAAKRGHFRGQHQCAHGSLRPPTKGQSWMYRFSGYDLDLQRQELRRAGDVIRVDLQVFDVPVLPIERRDRGVTRDETLEAIRGGRIVYEATLSSRVDVARKSGNSGNEHKVSR